MRILFSLLMLCAFSLSVLVTDAHALEPSHEHGCSTTVEHVDVSDSHAPTSGEHHHCVSHCLHVSLLPIKSFGFTGWILLPTFGIHASLNYTSPTLEDLTPPPLKA